MEKALLIRPGFLTQKELKFAREQFQKKEFDNPEVLEKLDAMLSRLRFFSLLNKDARLEFYRWATYVQKGAGTYIYHEGEPGDLMYIILKGKNLSFFITNITRQRECESKKNTRRWKYSYYHSSFS